jgi:hypothetical protein
MSTHTGPDPVWVRYNPRSAMLLVLAISRDAELAHRRLCDYVWAGAEWPAPDYRQAGEVGKVPRKLWPSVLRELHSVGWRTHAGRLCNPAIGAIREDAVAACEARRASSLAANQARWHPAASPSRSPDRSPDALPTGLQSKIREDEKKKREDHAVNDERLTLSSEPPRKGDDRERNFLKELSEGFHRFSPKDAVAESKNWGGWWRNRYRENPDKAQRVLNEVLSMIKERKIKRNPGAAGVDLWNRLP